MRFSQHRFLNTTIHLNLALAIGSSFFIIPGIHMKGILLPQFFYFFAVIALTGIAARAFLFPIASNPNSSTILKKQKNIGIESKEKTRKIGFYAALFFVLFVFFAVNAWFFAAETGTAVVPYYKDLLRVIFLMIFFIAALSHASREPSSLSWMTGALFVPLVIAPFILIRDIDAVRGWFPFDFFAGYTLQAFQHNQSSLGAWLIVPFGILAPFVFIKIHSRKRFFAAFSLLVAAMGLIWWTNSRGAILAALLILLGSGLFAKWRREITFTKLFALVVSVSVLGFLILPLQAQNVTLIRFYPQFNQYVRQNKFSVSFSEITKNITSSRPDFLRAQNRQTFWPEYARFVSTHPLGEFGPALPFENKGFFYKGAEHNTILQAGVWGGWGALSILVYLFCIVFSDAIRTIRRKPSATILVGLLMAFAGVLILALLNSFLQEKTLWFLAGILAAYSLRDTSELKSSS